MATTQALQRPGGWSARIQQQVHRAVIDLLQEHEGDELTIAQVAERSGATPPPSPSSTRTVSSAGCSR